MSRCSNATATRSTDFSRTAETGTLGVSACNAAPRRVQQSPIRRLTARDQLTRLLAAENARFPEQFSVDLPPDTSPPTTGGMRTGSGAVATPIPSTNSGAGRLSGRSLLTREMLAKMKPRDIARVDWNEVKQVVGQ